MQFLLSKGHEAGLAWEAAFDEKSLRTWRERMSGRTWLVHESSWLSRRLGSHAQVALWVEQARAAGITLTLPFHHGKDCIDCGGEGAYPRLFAEQAAQMARDIWERDRHRAQGVLCFSQRCASHLRAALGGRSAHSFAFGNPKEGRLMAQENAKNRTMILVNPQAREGAVGKKWPDLEHQLLGALGEGQARVEFTSASGFRLRNGAQGTARRSRARAGRGWGWDGFRSDSGVFFRRRTRF